MTGDASPGTPTIHSSTPAPGRSSVGSLTGNGLLAAPTTDVGATRERVRQHRLRWLALALSPIAAWLVVRATVLHRGSLGIPHLSGSLRPYLPAILLIGVLTLVMVVPLIGAGRSPHVLYRPGDSGVRFTDVRGAPALVEEVTKTLNIFLAHRTFGESMGGSPRRAVLFEGPPGTGKTFLAKAMASEAGVPFLFVSSSAFQSMFYGQTNRKIRSYFRALRRYARMEGGAIGFIEEIDAIGAARSGLGTGVREGISGVVNELLVQLQSFDAPPLRARLAGIAADLANLWLPSTHQFQKPATPSANILVIGATNRASDLDPALLRPGRFDRSIYFDLPSRAGRLDILDYYLGKKAHDPELDAPAARSTLAAITAGYSPVMIEHLLDEALVWALRREAGAMTWADITQAKMTDELGLAQDTVYTDHEREMIATHEAGHATVAWSVGSGRKLDVLSIVKRRSALGLLAHSGVEERFTQTRSEVAALIEIALGGMAAEEVFFGETSSGVASDLKAATDAACQMVGSLGMGSSLISAESLQIPGAANLAAKVLATDEGRAEVEELLQSTKERARDVIDANKSIVEALRDALLAREELVGDEILAVIDEATRR